MFNLSNVILDKTYRISQQTHKSCNVQYIPDTNISFFIRMDPGETPITYDKVWYPRPQAIPWHFLADLPKPASATCLKHR